MPFERYKANWPDSYKGNDLLVEMRCIQNGGFWKSKSGTVCGEGLSFHYERMRRILWPYLDNETHGQRWHSLCRDTVLKSKITILMGCGSSGKTHSAAWIFLCEYFCFPEETCVLVSSTDMNGLRMRVWGEINKLWSEAVARFDFLPGHLIDSRMLIATDDLSDAEDDERITRDWRKGIKGVPCMQNTKFVGLGKYVGIKQKRMRLIADEAQFMPSSFLSAFTNLDKNEDFKAIVLGNPIDPTDSLGKAAEPKDGWSGHMEPTKTEVWETRFMNGRCVNLVGTDSPNFDFPADEPTRFKYLISKEKIENTLSFWPKDSLEYYSQCVGVMKIGVLARRVVTREMCQLFNAQDDVTWLTNNFTRIAALDAAYSGDRCVAGYADFAKDVNGDMILKIYPPVIVPVVIREDMIAEDQIATYLRHYATENNIKPENFFHDSTGRGSLGTSLARIWSNLCNPVEFGGRPTNRPVSLDLFIDDPETKMRRHKRCDEHYDRFVTELAFSVRYVIEGRQMRNLPSDVMDELCHRKWDKIRNDKISIEPKTGTSTKPGFKERMGFSPDLADWISIIVEGARRRGFEIKKLASAPAKDSDDDWFKAEAKRYRTALNSNLLKHA